MYEKLIIYYLPLSILFQTLLITKRFVRTDTQNNVYSCISIVNGLYSIQYISVRYNQDYLIFGR
jgi:hypothetical protein